MGSFGGLGAEPPTAGGLAGSRGRRRISIVVGVTGFKLTISMCSLIR